MSAQTLSYHDTKFNKLKTTVVVEFVGPTGAGKSTNCAEFLKVLRERHVAAASFSDFKKWFYKSSYLIQLSILLTFITKDGAMMLRFITLLRQRGILKFDSIKRFFKLGVFNRALDAYKRKLIVDIVILDQWVIQGLWSATIFQTESSDDLAHAVRKYFFPVDHVFYFDIDAQTAAQRIGGRQTGRSRFDKMDAEKRLRETERFNDYLRRLFDESECRNKRVYSALETPSKNAEDFLLYYANSINAIGS